MKVLSIVGARPQFIKCGPVSRELRKVFTEVLVHTGQHYNENMSEAFFRELDLPCPDYNLGVNAGSHAHQTGEMMKKLEKVVLAERPDYVLVYGDTNSTLAGSLTASKLQIPIAHVEAGLRSFNREMPEEINRIVTDHLSHTLFCPTETALKNLGREGITSNVHLVGDVMYDALWENLNRAKSKSKILDKLGLQPQEYTLATVHRAENTDNSEKLANILEAFTQLGKLGNKIIFPVHPRTKKCMLELTQKNYSFENLMVIEPLSYLDMLRLESQASAIITDSGGVQKEAFWLRVPCVTLRNETEWMETVEEGWNVLVGANVGKIVRAVETAKAGHVAKWPWGKGEASRRIVQILGS